MSFSAATPPTYTVTDAIAVTGTTRAQLEYLADLGILAPTLQRAAGKRRYYSFAELVALRAARTLLATDVRVTRQIIDTVRTTRDEALENGLLVADDGGRLWVEPVNTFAALLERTPALEQSLALQVINLGQIVQTLRSELDIRGLPAPSPPPATAVAA